MGGDLITGDRLAQVLYLCLILAALAGWVMVEYRQRMGQALRVASAWGLIFLGLMAGYGLWTDLRRDILPQQMEGKAGEMVIPRAQDGHYYLQLQVNGETVTFMADTGATNVVLSPKDARRLGIDPGALNFLSQAVTANGIVRTARVTLPELRFGPFTDHDLRAYVNETDMDGSLLGMDYLGLFQISIAGDRMILRR